MIKSTRAARAVLPLFGAILLVTGCLFGGGEDVPQPVPVLANGNTVETEFIVVTARLNEIDAVLSEIEAGAFVAGGGDGEEVIGCTAPYTLALDTATENEIKFVTELADCTTRGAYPEAVRAERDYRRAEVETEMWLSLENGHFTSFKDFVGNRLVYCGLLDRVRGDGS